MRREAEDSPVSNLWLKRNRVTTTNSPSSADLEGEAPITPYVARAYERRIDGECTPSALNHASCRTVT